MIGSNASDRFVGAALEAGQVGVWHRLAGSDEFKWGGFWDRIFVPSPGGFNGSFETLLSIVHPDDRPGLGQTIQEAREDEKPYSNTFRVSTPTGEWRSVRIWGRYERDEAGQIGSYGAFRDVTDLLALQGQVVASEKLAAVGRLVAGVAHEVNTPVQYVGDNLRFVREAWPGLTELLAAYGTIAAEAEAAGVAPAECRLAAELVDKIDLAFLRQEVGRALDEALLGVERIGEVVRAARTQVADGAGAG